MQTTATMILTVSQNTHDGIYTYTTASMALLDLTQYGSPVQQGITFPPQLGYLLDGVS